MNRKSYKFKVKSKKRRQIVTEKRERAEKMKGTRVTTTLISMVFTRMPKRCRGMTTWIKMQKKRDKRSKVEKEEVTPKRRV